MKKQKSNEKIDLSLTRQQKFNFDSKKIEDELDVKKDLYRKRNEVISLKKKLAKLEKNINKYKGTIILLSLLVIFLLIISISLFYIHINYEPKTITKEVIKELGGENIVFLGDSITYQYDLKKYYGDKIHLVNSGIDGNTTTDILSNMEERVYRYNPTKVVLLIGTNDIPYKSEEEIENNIIDIVNSIKKNRPNCKIYLESIYPVNDTNNDKINHGMVRGRKNEKIKNLNKKLERFAIETKDVTYINLYDSLLDENGNLNIDYTREGLHLTDEGYEVITKILKQKIKI